MFEYVFGLTFPMSVACLFFFFFLINFIRKGVDKFAFYFLQKFEAYDSKGCVVAGDKDKEVI